MVTQRQMFEAFGHRIIIYCTDGTEYEGFCCNFTPYYDNEPPEDEIAIYGTVNGGYGTIFLKHEIESIKILDPEKEVSFDMTGD